MTYFKETTRNTLSQREKNETIEAVDRAMIYLTERYRHFNKPDINSNYDVGDGLRYFRNIAPYFSKITSFIKGRTQPKHLYLERRKREIYWKAREIANETGADVEEVKSLFIGYMRNYLIP